MLLRITTWMAFVIASAFGQTTALPDPTFFAKKLFPILEKAQCRLCHNDNGVASATRLQFPPESATADEIARFGLALKTLVDSTNPDRSLLFRKPTNRLPHTGGERIHPGSEEEKALRIWIDYLATSKAPVDVSEIRARKVPSVLRRLTHSQYNHAVQDLLGDQTRPADRFPNEDYVHGFTNQAEEQSVSPLLAEAYNHAAEKLARNAFRGGDSQQWEPPSPAYRSRPYRPSGAMRMPSSRCNRRLRPAARFRVRLPIRICFSSMAGITPATRTAPTRIARFRAARFLAARVALLRA